MHCSAVPISPSQSIVSILSTVHKQPILGLITHLCTMAMLALKGTGRRVVAGWDWPLGCAIWAPWCCLNRRLAEQPLQCAWSITRQEFYGLGFLQHCSQVPQKAAHRVSDRAEGSC